MGREAGKIFAKIVWKDTAKTHSRRKKRSSYTRSEQQQQSSSLASNSTQQQQTTTTNTMPPIVGGIRWIINFTEATPLADTEADRADRDTKADA